MGAIEAGSGAAEVGRLNVELSSANKVTEPLALEGEAKKRAAVLSGFLVEPGGGLKIAKGLTDLRGARPLAKLHKERDGFLFQSNPLKELRGEERLPFVLVEPSNAVEEVALPARRHLLRREPALGNFQGELKGVDSSRPIPGFFKEVAGGLKVTAIHELLSSLLECRGSVWCDADGVHWSRGTKDPGASRTKRSAWSDAAARSARPWSCLWLGSGLRRRGGGFHDFFEAIFDFSRALKFAALFEDVGDPFGHCDGCQEGVGAGGVDLVEVFKDVRGDVVSLSQGKRRQGLCVSFVVVVDIEPELEGFAR